MMSIKELELFKNMSEAAQRHEEKEWDRTVTVEVDIQLRLEIFKRDVDTLKKRLNPQSKWQNFWQAFKELFK